MKSNKAFILLETILAISMLAIISIYLNKYFLIEKNKSNSYQNKMSSLKKPTS